VGEQFPKLDAKHREFIGQQQVFFTASAAPSARIKVSPRATEAFAIIDDKTVVYLDRTGSGNETAAHLKADGRLTIMFCAFSDPAKILRLYGRGEVLRRGSAAYDELLASAFAGAQPIGARQMIRLHLDLVKTSCGWGMKGSRHIGAKKTSSVSTACRPGGLTKLSTALGMDRRFRVGAGLRSA
jgi:Pyridoxamine 5'-phosphate oxidase